MSACTEAKRTADSLAHSGGIRPSLRSSLASVRNSPRCILPGLELNHIFRTRTGRGLAQRIQKRRPRSCRRGDRGRIDDRRGSFPGIPPRPEPRLDRRIGPVHDSERRLSAGNEHQRSPHVLGGGHFRLHVLPDPERFERRPCRTCPPARTSGLAMARRPSPRSLASGKPGAMLDRHAAARRARSAPAGS